MSVGRPVGRSVSRGLPDREKLRFDPLTRANRAEIKKEKKKQKNTYLCVIEVSAAGNRRIVRERVEEREESDRDRQT